MTRQAVLADVFTPALTRWGLRGDPVLWRLMADALKQVAMPQDRSIVQQYIEAAFHDLTGHPLSEAPDHLQVADTYRANGGMSSGIVSGLFWRETALPEILSRFDQAKP